MVLIQGTELCQRMGTGPTFGKPSSLFLRTSTTSNYPEVLLPEGLHLLLGNCYPDHCIGLLPGPPAQPCGEFHRQPTREACPFSKDSARNPPSTTCWLWCGGSSPISGGMSASNGFGHPATLLTESLDMTWTRWPSMRTLPIMVHFLLSCSFLK